jgi:hypothetical protein
MVPAPRSSYFYRKGIALGEVLRRSADSYEDARAQLVAAIGSIGFHDLLGLRCLDEKLNRAPLAHHSAAKHEFLNWAESAIGEAIDLDVEDRAFREAILALERGSYRSLGDIAWLVGDVLGSESQAFWAMASQDGDESALWLMLVLLRQRLWPQDVRFSKFKYRQYEAVLAAQCKLPLPVVMDYAGAAGVDFR